MKQIFVSLLILVSIKSTAQHCPWDCTGFLMIQTDASPAEMALLQPALVDSKQQLIIDTIYGTGKETYDTCKFLEWEDFVKHRKEKSKLHHWYNNDLALTFAKGHYVVHYNYCQHDGKALSIRYMGPGHGHYHFMNILADKRIHLHDISDHIYKKENEKILEKIDSKIIKVSRAQWGFQ